MGPAVADSNPLGVVLLGAGMVADIHLEAIAGAQGKVALRGIFSRRPERAARLLAKRPRAAGAAPRVYRSLEEMLDDASIEAAIVVTPPDARMDLIRPLSDRGIHILLEKPVARSLREAEAVVTHCETAGVTLGIVFQHRFRAAARAARRLVDEGALGALGVVETAVPWWREQSYYDAPGRGTYARDGGGVLITQAIHPIDLMLSLAGPVTRVQAMTATSRFHRMEAEDFAVAGLTFASGAVGALTASSCSFPGRAEWITLHFAKASLHLEAGVLTVAWRDGRIESFGNAGATGGGANPMAFTHEWHQAVLEDFAAAIRDGRAPAVTGRTALAAHRLIDAIERSARQGVGVEVAT